MKIENIALKALLLDFYGELLTKKQREIYELYNDEDFSLSEISERYNITRQAAHDTIKNAEEALVSYEKKLGFVEYSNEIKKATTDLEKLIEKYKEDKSLVRKLVIIKNRIEKIRGDV